MSQSRVTVTEEGAPPQTQQAQLVYDRWMLDVPKLLDVAALYGPDNLQLTREFMSKVNLCSKASHEVVQDLLTWHFILWEAHHSVSSRQCSGIHASTKIWQ